MNEFIALDFETGSHASESVISIGLVKYRNFRPMASYYSLIRPPELFIRPDFTDIHGLTVKDVRHAPDFRYIWEKEINGFFGGAPLVAHNAAFDMRALNAVLAFYGIPAPEIRFFCSLKLSRKVWPGLPSHALSALAEEHGIVYSSHEALSDADTCARIVSLAAETVSRQAGSKKVLSLSGVLKRAGITMQILGEPERS